MESDLRSLIDDPRFRAYHQQTVKPEFNAFDVLRYADYEIRHSNVLAWLLAPDDTHGLGARFLKWFVDYVDKQLVAANAGPLPTVGFEVENVDVWRERDYVDITLRFRRERFLIAIENKTGPASLDHVDQVRGYERELSDKHKEHTLTSVLLTTSSDDNVNFPGITHVAWESVHKAIGSFLFNGNFHSSDVRVFISQYLDIVERWFRSTGIGGFKDLLDAHRSVLQELRRLLDKYGEKMLLWEDAGGSNRLQRYAGQACAGIETGPHRIAKGGE